MQSPQPAAASSSRPNRSVPWRLILPLLAGGVVLGFGLGFAGGQMFKKSRSNQLVASSAPSPEAPKGAEIAAPKGALAAPGDGPSQANAEKPGSRAGEQPEAAPIPSLEENPQDNSPEVQGAADAPAPEPAEGELDPKFAYLEVKSSISADVWVLGKNIGKTNARLKLDCNAGPRFTRLGKFLPNSKAPTWISAHSSPEIPCGKLTNIELEPLDEFKAAN